MLSGAPDSKTIRVNGRINGTWIVILIDSSSTYYFIDINITSRDNMKMSIVVKVRVQLANGDIIQGKGKV